MEMLKPITLKPAAYISIAIVVLLIFAYFLFRSQESFLSPNFEEVEYGSIADLLKSVEKFQKDKNYHAIINTLNRADIDALVSAEVRSRSPRVITIDGDQPSAPGLEKPGEYFKEYGFISFPDTTDVVRDVNRAYWILWARGFVERYNAKIEFELKKKKNQFAD